MVVRYVKNGGFFVKFRLSVHRQWDRILFGCGERFAIRTGRFTLGKTTLIRIQYFFSACHVYYL